MWSRFEFEVIDMDRQRIDKVLVTQKAPKEMPKDDEEVSED
jgi:CBS domain containing-hemolysin-like protein